MFSDNYKKSRNVTFLHCTFFLVCFHTLPAISRIFAPLTLLQWK
jgi:hypothetical protein